MAKKKIFITAGEVSGDVNASHLVRAVKDIDPDIEFAGIGGRHLREAGVRLLADSSTWGSIGFLEGVVKGFVILPVARRLAAMFEQEKPDLYVPVDYRFFSMRGARIAKSRGIPVVYYFSPVSWFGSGGKRFEELAATIDLSLVALPLSLDQYREAGVNFQYIGHPLVDAVKPSMTREEALRFFGLEGDGPVIGFMPGSRGQEIKRLMPVFARAARIIQKESVGARFIAFRAIEQYDFLIKKCIGDAPVSVAHEKVYDFMNVCDVLALCSGTATHEAAILGKPMVVCYKINPVTGWIVRKTVNPPMIGLPNIIGREFVVPELVQEACTPESVADETVKLLKEEDIRTKTIEKLGIVRDRLGKPGVLERAAKLVVEAVHGDLSIEED